MNKNEMYVWYSGATDVTGKALQEALGIKGGKVSPPNDIKLVIGWGAKTNKDIKFKANQKVFNHPNYIRKNRNKLEALQLMKDGGCNVSEYSSKQEVTTKLKNGTLQYPLIGRTKYHQGGKGFWIILNNTQLKSALADGAQYFQNYINISGEFRLHIFQGELIYAVRKVKRSNLKKAFITQFKEKLNAAAEKAKEVLEDKTLDYTLSKLAGVVVPKADMIIRSNTRGWKFSRLVLNTVNKELKTQAIKALKLLNMDSGAVDCCIDEDGKAWIIEVNSGPGLQGSSLDSYVKAFQAFMAKLEEPKAKKPKVLKELKNKLVEEVDNAKVKKADGVKVKLAHKLKVLENMLAAANDEEAAVLEKLWNKL